MRVSVLFAGLLFATGSIALPATETNNQPSSTTDNHGWDPKPHDPWKPEPWKPEPWKPEPWQPEPKPYPWPKPNPWKPEPKPKPYPWPKPQPYPHPHHPHPSAPYKGWQRSVPVAEEQVEAKDEEHKHGNWRRSIPKADDPNEPLVGPFILTA